MYLIFKYSGVFFIIRFDMIYRNKMAYEFNYMYGKTKTLMYYKNVKKLLKYCVVK